MIGPIATIHTLLSNTVVLFFFILGAWGAYRGSRGQGVDSSYLGALVIGQGLYIVQAVLGFLLWFNGLNAGLSRPEIHMLYGLFALVFMPFVYLVWLRGDDSNRAQWVLTFTTFFLFGIALRSITTGL